MIVHVIGIYADVALTANWILTKWVFGRKVFGACGSFPNTLT